MKATAIIRDLSDQFWNGFGDSIPSFFAQSPRDKLKTIEKLSAVMPRNVTLKVGNGAFRERVEWNQLMRGNLDAMTATIEPRRGYKLITFELSR